MDKAIVDTILDRSREQRVQKLLPSPGAALKYPTSLQRRQQQAEPVLEE
jgi:hypothetical protein